MQIVVDEKPCNKDECLFSTMCDKAVCDGYECSKLVCLDDILRGMDLIDFEDLERFSRRF